MDKLHYVWVDPGDSWNDGDEYREGPFPLAQAETRRDELLPTNADVWLEEAK